MRAVIKMWRWLVLLLVVKVRADNFPSLLTTNATLGINFVMKVFRKEKKRCFCLYSCGNRSGLHSGRIRKN